VDTEQTLLESLHADPGDDTARLALADQLEEQGRVLQAELLRLHLALRLRRDAGTPGREFARMCELLDAGVRPVVPERVNWLGMRFALIPAGAFWMGSPPQEEGRFADEGPVHRVELTWPYYLGVFPVTQREYGSVMYHNPSYFFNGDRYEGRHPVEGMDTRRHPVEMVSWDMAERFCRRLSELPEERRADRRYRLPTEAEWEYACRAGISFAGPFHQGATLSSRQANFNGRVELYGGAAEGPWLERTCPVDSYPPNAFGLYDLHGNVCEWCADWFAPRYYEECPEADPPGPATGERRVLRGGSWNDRGRHCRAAMRYNRRPEDERNDFGFRVVMEFGR
jgi:uncharacterized protein (TIGR02996 family)